MDKSQITLKNYRIHRNSIIIDKRRNKIADVIEDNFGLLGADEDWVYKMSILIEKRLRHYFKQF